MIRINKIQKNRLKMLMKNTLYYRFSQKHYCNGKPTSFLKKIPRAAGSVKWADYDTKIA